MLGFGLNQFPSGYSKSGDLQNALGALTWGADYLVAAHSSPNHFVAVVGNSTLDFNYYVSGPVAHAVSAANCLRFTVRLMLVANARRDLSRTMRSMSRADPAATSTSSIGVRSRLGNHT